MNEETKVSILAYFLVCVGMFFIPAVYAVLCYAVGV